MAADAGSSPDPAADAASSAASSGATSPSSASASAAGGASAVCTLPVYPKVVTASLRQAMKDINLDDADRRQKAVSQMELPEGLRQNKAGLRSIRDAAVIELNINSESVKEVDVMRGREMIRQQLEPILWSTEQQQLHEKTAEPDSSPSPSSAPSQAATRGSTTPTTQQAQQSSSSTTTTTTTNNKINKRGSMGSICLVVRRPG